MLARWPGQVIRVGLLGYGLVGRALRQRLSTSAHFSVAFVHTRSPQLAADLEPSLRVGDEELPGRLGEVDLVVEAAHPVLTARFGVQILAVADYLTRSTSGLVDDELRARLVVAGASSGRRLLLPHGALVGLESLIAGRDQWRDVRITFVKNPAHIEPSDGTRLPDDREIVVYDGSVRGIGALFPRNVNSMVTLALATVGLDRCRARLIARPGIDRARLELDAVGHDGSELSIRKVQPMAGVSGSEMVASTWASVLAATGRGDGSGGPIFV